MKIKILATVWITLLSVVAPAVGQERTPEVGFAQISTSEPVSGERVQIGIWYPVDRGNGQASASAEPAAPAPDKQRGLILISHRTAGTYMFHRDTAARLAESGWVVAAPLHAGDNVEDRSGVGTPLIIEGRPRTISAIIDTLEADPRFVRSVKSKNIGFVGHLAGGYTGLILAGAAPARFGPIRHCREQGDDKICTNYSIPSEVEGETTELITGLGEPRIRAEVLLAPSTMWFSDEALSQITIPIRIYYSEQDDEISQKYHGSRLERLLRNVEIVKEKSGSHLLFGRPLAPAGSSPASTPQTTEIDSRRSAINQEIVDFFDRSLR